MIIAHKSDDGLRGINNREWIFAGYNCLKIISVNSVTLLVGTAFPLCVRSALPKSAFLDYAGGHCFSLRSKICFRKLSTPQNKCSYEFRNFVAHSTANPLLGLSATRNFSLHFIKSDDFISFRQITREDVLEPFGFIALAEIRSWIIGGS